MRWVEPSFIRVLPEEILEAQGADPASLRERRPALWEHVSEAIAVGSRLIRPVVWEKEISVLTVHHRRVLLDGGCELSGPLVADHLAGAECVVLGITTLGPEIDAEIRSWMERDVAFGVLLDSYGSVAAETLATSVQESIIAEKCSSGLSASMPLSPGLTGWPIDAAQPQIFRAIEPDPKFIRLTPMAQMVPRKSCSFVIGIGKDMTPGVPCDYCALQNTCIQRKQRVASDA